MQNVKVVEFSVASVLTNGMDSNEPRWRVPLTIWLLLFFVGLLYFLDVFQIEEYYTITSAKLPNRGDHKPKESRAGFLIKTKGCRIPFMDPMDKTIIEFIQPAEPVTCNKGIPALFDFNDTSIFLQNSSLPFYNLADASTLQCCYQVVKRRDPKNSEQDFQITINDTCISFNESVNIEEEYILVKCKNSTSVIYKDLFWFVPSKVDGRSGAVFDGAPLNVLIVGLDGVSRLNLHRQMPKTVKYMNELEAVEYFGYNKVGDNTFPNLLPVLTGLTVDEVSKTCWKNDGHFDNCTFLWNLYKNKGYMTSFGEDSAWMGIFNYGKNGFFKQPTDYAYGYYNKIAESKIGNQHDMNVNQCIGDREVYNDFLNYILALSRRFKTDNVPYFAFYWGASLSHDHLNKPALGDDTYTNFFETLNDSGLLDNTVLIFMSDHGIRWGGIRHTYQGKVEERLPFVYIKMPRFYREIMNQAYNNLKENAYKLTTPFDLHETLMDLLQPYDLTDNFIHKRNGSLNRGVSLFNEIPGTRTCEAAGIASHWCTCQESREVSVNDTSIVKAATYAVYHMNKLLVGHADCAILELDDILNARIMTHGHHIIEEKSKNTETHDFMVTFQTRPGGGVFESTIRKFKNRTHEIMGTISRLNLYGQQSKCITEFHLKLYCYCKSFF